MMGDVVMVLVGLTFGAIGGGVFVMWANRRLLKLAQEAINYWREDSFRWQRKALELDSGLLNTLPIKDRDTLEFTLHEETLVERFRNAEGRN